nr:hypothetical protein [Tanacetum cinerariifolium]
MTEANDPNIIPTNKGKLPLVEAKSISIADINPTLLNQTIEVRVYRKWVAKNVATQVASNFYVILLDKQGNAIQATMDLKDTDYFSELLQLNDAYRILRFRCTSTKAWDRTLSNNITLNFGRYTSIVLISNANFLEHYFNFVAYNEVEQRATKTGVPLTDCIGCVYRISDPLRSGDATRTRHVCRVIDIQNLDGIILRYLIWGDTAETFDMDEYNKMEKLVIIVVASAWATKKYGGLQLSLTSATHYYLNPNIPEAKDILNIYADFITPTPALEILRQLYSNPLLEQTRNRYNIETLLSVNPHHYKAIINDGTATATVTCFSLEAHTFVPDCNTIVNTIKDKDTSHLPIVLTQAEGHTYIFQYHFGQQSKPGYPNFTLDAVLQPLLVVPAPETIKSPAAQVLEEASVGKNTTTATEGPSESGKLGVESPSQMPEEKAKKARRGLF